MSSPLNDTLLEGEANATSRSYRPLVGVTMVGLMVMVGLAGYSIGKSASQPGVDTDVILAQLVGNQTELVVVPYSQSCYGFTGGTCLQSACKDWRGAQCVDGKCVCTTGCTGTDGKCYRGSYTKVASGFSLKNYYWSNSWLYMQRAGLLGQLQISGQPSFTFGGAQNFDLIKLPGTVKGKTAYFMASSKWPSWVAAIKTTGSVLSGSVSPYGLFAVNLYHTIAPWDPQGIVVQVCHLGKIGKRDQIMIGNPSGEWAYVHRGSWFVYGWGSSQDPGTGGYWTPSKTIPGLDAC